MNINVEVSDLHFLSKNTKEVAHQLKLHSALLRFHAGEISAGSACQFVEVDRYTFLEACKRYRISPFGFEADEVFEEADSLLNKLRK